ATGTGFESRGMFMLFYLDGSVRRAELVQPLAGEGAENSFGVASFLGVADAHPFGGKRRRNVVAVQSDCQARVCYTWPLIHNRAPSEWHAVNSSLQQGREEMAWARLHHATDFLGKDAAAHVVGLCLRRFFRRRAGL